MQLTEEPSRPKLRLVSATPQRLGYVPRVMKKPTTHQVAQAGQHFVAAELHRRGAHAVTFAGNMPRIDVLATNIEQTRTVGIQVKTKTARDWQTTLKEEQGVQAGDSHFWIFVDLGAASGAPEYYVVPEEWIERNIKETHQAYLDRHGGKRARSPLSKHHSIQKNRIEQWRDRWDLLGIL